MDSNKISEIAAVMEQHGLARVRLEEADGTAVELEREGAAPAPAAPVVAVPAAGSFSAPAAPARPAAPAPASQAPAPAPQPAADDARHTLAVSAPMVGVFYAAPSPDAEPFVKVGSKVKKGETLCVLEAMKVMNEVVAEEDGEVVDVCVKDGQLVEYGCCLMKIKGEEEA